MIEQAVKMTEKITKDTMNLAMDNYIFCYLFFYKLCCI